MMMKISKGLILGLIVGLLLPYQGMCLCSKAKAKEGLFCLMKENGLMPLKKAGTDHSCQEKGCHKKDGCCKLQKADQLTFSPKPSPKSSPANQLLCILKPLKENIFSKDLFLTLFALSLSGSPPQKLFILHSIYLC
ncbi:hypothetical protein KKC52_06250 [bacterium]|nr:hypothetical protein [bacterium]